MKTTDVFNMANEYAQTGDTNMAVQLWTKCTQMDEFFAPAYINLYEVFKNTGQIGNAINTAEKLFNCPMSWNTSKVMPRIENELADIKKKQSEKK